MKTNLKRGLLALATFATVAAASHDALAIIGRPLTPVSFAGVARRSVRRTAYGVGAYGAYGAYPYAAGTVAAMPPGCYPGTPCGGGVVYQPAYSGPNVVYVPQ